MRVRSIQGGELFFHLKNNRRFSEEVARIYVGQIALALGHLHSMSIIYRDLKPEVRARCDRTGARGVGRGMRPRRRRRRFRLARVALARGVALGMGLLKAVRCVVSRRGAVIFV